MRIGWKTPSGFGLDEIGILKLKSFEMSHKEEKVSMRDFEKSIGKKNDIFG